MDGDNRHMMELIAFIEHIGRSTKSGHYVAYVRHGAQWYKKNDKQVSSAYNHEHFFL